MDAVNLDKGTKNSLISYVAFWQFFAKRLFFAESFSYDHRIINYPLDSP